MTMIFLDLETTGLTPGADHILEIAAAKVDNTLTPVDGFGCVIHRTPQELQRCDATVREMHSRNGLFAEVATSEISVHKAYDALVRWLGDVKPGSLTLAGDSVHFDLGFLRADMPLASRLFSHRLLDVSAFRVARDFMGMASCPVAPSTHRAQADVLASIAKARWHLSRVGV